ncbi:TraX family protein [Lysinibacillus yapensis]|nr:TraX family protein [Lysinibacillus yapensis]
MQSTTFNQVNVLQRDISSNSLKYIAIAAMFFDHLFAVFLAQDSMEGILSRIPGRIVAPIMCYLIAEGFFYTSDVRRYIKRLVIFAAISHFPYVLYFDLPWWKATSVIWSLALGLIALTVYKSDKISIYFKVPLILFCCMLAIPADWNYVAVLWILFFGIFRGNIVKQMISFVLIGLIFHIIPSVMDFGWARLNQLGILIAIPLLVMYKGRRGRKSKALKWGFYVFYPLHLILLFILYKALF